MTPWDVAVAGSVGALSALCISACNRAPAETGTARSSDRALVVAVKAFRATDALPGDPDDPSIWVNKTDPSHSLIITTMKIPAPDGGVVVFGLDGKQRQILRGADRPNNVDVEYGLELDATPTDVAVVTERLGRRLRVYAIAPDGSSLRDISAGRMPVLEGAVGDEGAPMGIGLYRRPRDGAVFAIISAKAGPKTGYLWQYRLADDGTGRVGATFVRRFGAFSGVGEIEAIVVDDSLGYVYYADETAGIHKWHADPDADDADRELALFATAGYQQDREGLGIYDLGDGSGYLVSVHELPLESVFHIYSRDGEPARPHDHHEVAMFTGGADGTDGLDVTSAPLGPEFPDGLLVVMNSASRNFLLYRWRDIVAAVGPPLRVRPQAP